MWETNVKAVVDYDKFSVDRSRTKELSLREQIYFSVLREKPIMSFW